MTSKPKTAPETPEDNPNRNPGRSKGCPRPRKPRRPSRSFSAEQKAQAVLAAWTERLSQTEVCRQMQVNYVTFQNWQNRAMEGMLQALDNQLQLTDTTVLSPRLRKLMDRGRGLAEDRLGRRLERLQQVRDNGERT